VEALAIRGEKIVAAGSNKEVQAFEGKGTKVIDLKGRFVMPGFNDAHTHLANAGQAKLAIDLTGAKSLAEFQARIREGMKSAKPGEWLLGRGWDHTLWPEKRFPTRHDLDAVSKDHPMIFGRVDGHVAVANTKALELAGITRDTPNPPGGEIERDAKGEATGMLKEGSAQGLVRRKVPPTTPDQRRRGIELAIADAARHGVTSVQDNSSWDDFLVYRQLKSEGKLTVRVSEWLPFNAPVERLKQLQQEGGSTDPWLRTAGLKGVVDGALGGLTAALLAPYSDDPSTSGILIIPADRLRDMVVERDKAGFQINLHAIGDRANRAALDAFAAARVANGTRDSRHRIEHAQVLAPDDLLRLAKHDVIGSMQPNHQTTDSRWAGDRLGPERSKGAYAWNSLQKSGARLAFGTDYPVEPINTMRGLFACVTREVDGQPGSTWQPQEKISMDDCIQWYTAGSAYAEFAEKEKGKLIPGHFADFVVLSADLTKIPHAQILKTEVLMTFTGGRLVYEKK
jgi:predicted amidohydrolase YtcJ